VSEWDRAAEWYLNMAQDPAVGFNHLAADIAADLLGDVAGRDVLDVGAGAGTMAVRLANLGAHVAATEPTEVLRRAAAATTQLAGLDITVGADPAEDLAGLADRAFDAVLHLLVLHHVEPLGQALAEAHRVLRPGGVLVVVVPHPWSTHPDSAWLERDRGIPRLAIGDYTSECHWRSPGSGGVSEIGWYHRTVATWLTSIASTGFTIERVDEPVGDEPRRADGGGPWRSVPRFLAVRARVVPSLG
jgi:SAM-dependent methyltransferase